ncbi:MAG: GNAT family N-acetyltransferase [Rhodocyclaceae bacterium]
MTSLVKELSRFDLPALERHFLSLVGEDRRLRFGACVHDLVVCRYVKDIDFLHDAVFGVLDRDLELIAVARLGRRDHQAELGVSVLPGHRHLGIGAALLKRAHLHARNWGVQELFMYCLAENGPMMHLARKNGMDIAAASGDADARLNLPPADANSHMSAMVEQRIALMDYALKAQFAGARRVVDSFAAERLSRDRAT